MTASAVDSFFVLSHRTDGIVIAMTVNGGRMAEAREIISALKIWPLRQKIMASELFSVFTT